MRTQAALSALYLHKQAHRANIRKAGGGNVPAGRAGFFPAHLQRDVMPAVREQSPEALSGVNAIAIQQQAGVGIGVVGIGKFELADLLFHGGVLLFIRVFFSDACRITHLLRFYGRNLSDPLENDLLAQVQIRNCRGDPLPAPGRQHHVGDVVAGGVIVIVEGVHQLFIGGDVPYPQLRALDQLGGGQQCLTGQRHHLGLLIVRPVPSE